MTEVTAPQVLIVDDEAAHVKALCDTLGAQGYLTVGCTGARDALARARATRFDLLLADLMMPEMDGIALLQAALEIDPDLVGVIMTGEGTIVSAVDAMKAGAFDYILKPFKLSAILPVLSRALAVRRLKVENAALERSVRERTAELENSNKDLEAFSDSVSHDLRAPLRAIGGFSAALAKDFAIELPPDAQHLLERVTANVGRMERLIADLLRLSRLGRQPLSRHPVDVAGLVREVVDGLWDEHHGGVDVRIGGLPSCVGDPGLLKQVFVNLLSNAFKFSRGKDGAFVEVGFREANEPAYFVRDNGAGFDMRYADKLFGVFQRLHSADEFDGTGVGLSIVHRIIHRHGGRIWAEAKVGAGATFYFTLASG